MGVPRAEPVAVIGAGSWGTALAIQMARGGRRAILWGRDPHQLAAMRAERRNARYLPDASFPAALHVEPSLDDALAACGDVLVAVPSHAFRATLAQLATRLRPAGRVAWATKGFEAGSGLLPHQVAHEVLGARKLAVLSGPTFAREVGAGLPTAMTVASPDEDFAGDIAERLAGPNFRAYTQPDIVGVETGGAVKNVIAIGCGIADGMGFGANTRVALITRGLAEMMRLGVRLGASRDTLMGLAGLGDLVLTCTGSLSRNHSLGVELGKGRKLIEIIASMHGMVAEGVLTTDAAIGLALKHQIEMPITEQTHALLHEGKSAREAIHELMTRPFATEVKLY